jgi:hypothetical protein
MPLPTAVSIYPSSADFFQMIKGTGYTKEKGGVKDQRGYRAKLYCVCQKPYTGEFMIRCDECKE